MQIDPSFKIFRNFIYHLNKFPLKIIHFPTRAAAVKPSNNKISKKANILKELFRSNKIILLLLKKCNR